MIFVKKVDGHLPSFGLLKRPFRPHATPQCVRRHKPCKPVHYACHDRGVASKTERQFLIDASKKGTQAVKLAAKGGVVPGGGTAFLHCLEAVEAEVDNLAGDQKAGGRVMLKALTAPFQKICTDLTLMMLF